MLIVDAHLDIALNALQERRDMLSPVQVTRDQEQGRGEYGETTVSFPEMRRGRVALCFATLCASSANLPIAQTQQPQNSSYQFAKEQLRYYQSLEEHGHIRIISDATHLVSHLAEWQAWDTPEEDLVADPPPLGFVISIEGADPIIDPEQLAEWYEGGVRLIGPAHFGDGRYTGGTGSEVGLTDLGRRLLQQMMQLHMPLDLSHLSDAAFWQTLTMFECAVFASHSNCRTLVPHPRQLTDKQLRAILDRGGVIGVTVANWMTVPGWVIGESSNHGISIATVVDHIDHISQLAGHCHQVGLGTDLDGGFGIKEIPADMDTIADLQMLAEQLRRRGFTEPDIAAVLHGNWIDFLHRAWS